MGSSGQGSATDMKHNNQIHSVRKFRKYWQRYVKTWFNQPARKKARRTARDKKAAAVAPRPVAGSVRPLVHGATLKYNSKVRTGRGFSLAEIKDAGLGKLEAQSLGVSVDPRRRNRSVQGKQANVQRLKEYKANLVVFPPTGSSSRRAGRPTPPPRRPRSPPRLPTRSSWPLLPLSTKSRPARSPRRSRTPSPPVCSRLPGTTLAFAASVRSAPRSVPRRPPRRLSR